MSCGFASSGNDNLGKYSSVKPTVVFRSQKFLCINSLMSGSSEAVQKHFHAHICRRISTLFRPLRKTLASDLKRDDTALTGLAEKPVQTRADSSLCRREMTPLTFRK